MKGTEKQITWAENIQKTALDTLQRNIDRMKAANVKSYERTIKAFEKCKEELLVFHIYKNHEGLLMVETEWGFCYEINEILEGNETPCFYALDRDKKGHRVYLKIVEEQ